MATIKQVAELAGVSTASVSRALSGSRPVSPEVADRIRLASEQLGYRPNRVARSLRTQVSSTIGLLVSDIQNPFFTAVARSAETLASHHGFSTVLCNSDDDLERELRYLEVLAAERVAGLIITPADEEHSTVRVALDAGLPVVCLDRRLRTATLDTVLVDNAYAVRKAVDLLYAEGCRRIGFVTAPPRSTTASERLRGYREALTRHGLPVEDRLVAHSVLTGGDVPLLGDETHRLVSEVLERGNADALLVTNGPLIAGSLAAIAGSDRVVGRDLAVVVFDDLPLGEYIGLTTIVQPTAAMAHRAVQLLLERLAGTQRPAREIIFNAELVVRPSSTLMPN